MASVCPVGRGVELEGVLLDELQQSTNDAFVRPVYRVTLRAPLLAFRFYGDLCARVTRLYASLFTVMRIPGFDEPARNLLGLTGRNSANNLVAVSVQPGSRIVFGGISNRAHWADQILVERNAGIQVIDNLARYRLAAR